MLTTMVLFAWCGTTRSTASSRDGPARIGLQHLHVGGRARGSGADHEGGGAVAEDHARGTHGADLVGELLPAHDEDGTLYLLEEPHRLREPVGQAGAGRHDVAGGVGLED